MKWYSAIVYGKDKDRLYLELKARSMVKARQALRRMLSDDCTIICLKLM